VGSRRLQLNFIFILSSAYVDSPPTDPPPPPAAATLLLDAGAAERDKSKLS
jgi:hypothetical protein